MFKFRNTTLKSYRHDDFYDVRVRELVGNDSDTEIDSDTDVDSEYTPSVHSSESEHDCMSESEESETAYISESSDAPFIPELEFTKFHIDVDYELKQILDGTYLYKYVWSDLIGIV